MSAMDSPLERVLAAGLCAGCGACAAVAPDKISMQTVTPGFLRPRSHAALTAGEAALIGRICPGLGQRVEAGGRRDDTLWGPYLRMSTGWASDPVVRFAGASGGALSALVGHLLESGTVDAVVANRAADAAPLANATVLATRREEILVMAGSRYAPSAPLAGVRELAASGRRHAFVGKPCDVAALRVWAAEDATLAAAFPVMLSFFCAGIPSQTGAREILRALGVSEGDVMRFRYRGNGWPGRATATLRDGSERSMSYHDSWGGILSHHIQHRCKICADGTGTAADIVCADAWESDAAGYPLFEEADGVSLIVARTELGARLLDGAVEAGALQTAPFDVARLASIQPGQRERRRALLARLLALRLCWRPVPRYEGLHLWAAARQNPLSRNLRNFLGMLRRELRARLARSRGRRDA